MTTVAEIKARREHWDTREGLRGIFYTRPEDPPLQLRCKETLNMIAEGEIVTVRFIDEDNQYPDHVNFHGIPYCWHADFFEIVE